MNKMLSIFQKISIMTAFLCIASAGFCPTVFTYDAEIIPQKLNTFFEYMAEAGQEQWIGYIQGEVLVKFIEGVEPSEVLRDINLDAQHIERLYPIQPAVSEFKNECPLEKTEDGDYWFAGKTYKSQGDIPDSEFFKEVYKDLSDEEKELYRIYRIYLPEGTTVQEVVDALNSSSQIEQALPHYVIQSF